MSEKFNQRSVPFAAEVPMTKLLYWYIFLGLPHSITQTVMI